MAHGAEGPCSMPLHLAVVLEWDQWLGVGGNVASIFSMIITILGAAAHRASREQRSSASGSIGRPVLVRTFTSRDRFLFSGLRQFFPSASLVDDGGRGNSTPDLGSRSPKRVRAPSAKPLSNETVMPQGSASITAGAAIQERTEATGDDPTDDGLNRDGDTGARSSPKEAGQPSSASACRPYSHLSTSPLQDPCPACGRSGRARDMATKTLKQPEELPRQPLTSGELPHEISRAHLSSTLTCWLRARTADSGANVVVDNHGWLPVGEVIATSSPPIFRSAVSGLPSDTVVLGSIDGESNVLLHFDDVTVARAREAAKFFLRPKMTVTIVLRFYDWLTDEFRETRPFEIDIPVASSSAA